MQFRGHFVLLRYFLPASFSEVINKDAGGSSIFSKKNGNFSEIFFLTCHSSQHFIFRLKILTTMFDVRNSIPNLHFLTFFKLTTQTETLKSTTVNSVLYKSFAKLRSMDSRLTGESFPLLSSRVIFLRSGNRGGLGEEGSWTCPSLVDLMLRIYTNTAI